MLLFITSSNIFDYQNINILFLLLTLVVGANFEVGEKGVVKRAITVVSDIKSGRCFTLQIQ